MRDEMTCEVRREEMRDDNRVEPRNAPALARLANVVVGGGGGALRPKAGRQAGCETQGQAGAEAGNVTPPSWARLFMSIQQAPLNLFVAIRGHCACRSPHVVSTDSHSSLALRLDGAPPRDGPCLRRSSTPPHFRPSPRLVQIFSGATRAGAGAPGAPALARSP